MELKTVLLIVLCCCFLWRLRLRLRVSKRTIISPALTTVLLGFAVMVAHLLFAKFLWGFPWAGFVAGISSAAMVAPGIGYFYVRRRRHSCPIRHSGIDTAFSEPSRGAGILPPRFTGEMREVGIVENRQEAAQFVMQVPRWPRCKPLGIPIPPRMAQNRCNRTQKNHPAQLPNPRF